MICLTVKTLDAQNHNFEVDDDITVEQFKAKIADTVNIPADTQRIIYCGRVLQDSSKLSEYDVNGKVVHLVQRAPPGANNRNANRASSPQPQRNRTFQLHGLEPGNAMYLGSMAFPPNLMESQGIVPPPPTHTLAGSRLNVARRMLKRAEAAIRVLENPQARATDLPAEEPQEEVTPVIEARVIVPSNNTEPIDEAMVLSAVHDTLLNATGRSTDGEGNTSVIGESNTAETSRTQSASSTPEGTTPTRSSTENLATGDPTSEPSGSGQNSNGATNSFPENASRSTEMAELLTMLANLQLRFAPFLERYHTFMQQDPVVAPEDVLQTQAMLTRVSGVLHCLGHAYHSLSDIIIRVRTPPPRPLLCRPIIIQHSAVVQAGIPIQVEAQINLSAERGNENGQQQQPQRDTNATASTEASSNNTAPTATSETANSQLPQGASIHINNTPLISAQIQPMMGFPFLPGASMRVQSFPIEVHGVRHTMNPNNTNAAQPQNNNNNTTNTGGAASSEATPVSSVTSTSSNATNETSSSSTAGTTENNANNTANRDNSNMFNLFNMQDNPNVELFMEVTPFATLDSMESTLVGGPNQQNEAVFRGALNGPPQNFLQSLIQMAGGMAGQVINRAAAAQQQMNGQPSTQPSAPPMTTNTTTPASTTAEADNTQANGSSPPSQATANTITTTTTSTHTRSTSRPHVHLAHQAMQGGFDPFLPCNSHHLPPRRRVRTHATAQTAAPTNNNTTRRENVSPTSTNGTSRPASANQARVNMPMAEQINAIINHMIMRMGGQVAGAGVIPGATASINVTRSTAPTPPSSTNNATNSSSASSGPNVQIPPFPFASFPGIQNIIQQNLRQGPRLIQLIQSLPPPGNYTQGDSLITDFLMMLAEHLTLGDVYTINTGNLEPLVRIRNEISNFFLTHIVNNSVSPEAIDGGVERIITEIRPFLEQFSVLQVRDNIDMPRSAEALFRHRLPTIVRLASSSNVCNNVNSMRLLVDQCLTTLRHLCALALYASVTGQNGVNEVADQFIARYIQGIPQSLQQWTFLSTRMQLMQFMSNLNVPDSILQPYIVKEPAQRVPTPPIPEPIQQQVVDTSQNLESEAMEYEEASASNSDLSSPPILEDNEIVPNYILGSESWHRQVPAHWVPIIARDAAQRQRRQNTQPPFSDAYLSGMPSKRRKIVNSNKPQGSLPQVISDSVRRAVTATGLSQVAPLETVSQAAGSSTDIQAAYRSLLRSNVQSNLTNNDDFTPERYPNASTYFNNTQ